MLSKIKKSRSEGFTIIEVMIVLAIAALILLIVLIAVPALQRSANNTSRKDDAQAIAGAISNFINNNSGTLPTGLGSGSNANQILVGTTTANEQANLGYYKIATTGTTVGAANPLAGSKIYFTNDTAAASAPSITPVAVGSETATAVSTNSVLVLTGLACNQNQLSLSPNDVSIVYGTDNGGTKPTVQCIQAS